MDYKEQAHKLELRFKYDRMGLLQLSSDLCKDCSDAGKSIIELLVRAETSEERCKELEERCKRLNEARERANEAAAKWESMYRVALERADDIGSWRKAMEERDAAISDMETVMAYGGANVDTCQFCENGQCYARGGTKLCLPKWRGKKE